MRKNCTGNLSSVLIHKVIIPFSLMMHNFRARNITSVSQQIKCRPKKSSKKANIRICNHIHESSPLRSYTKREENSHPTTKNSKFYSSRDAILPPISPSLILGQVSKQTLHTLLVCQWTWQWTFQRSSITKYLVMKGRLRIICHLMLTVCAVNSIQQQLTALCCMHSNPQLKLKPSTVRC